MLKGVCGHLRPAASCLEAFLVQHVAQQGISTCSILGFASLCCCRTLQSSQH